MRILRAIPLLLTIAVIYVLNRPLPAAQLPALGKILDPVNGCLASAEPVDKNFTANFKITGLQQPVTIWFDDRMVAHIFAANEHDMYLAEGYVHAYFRLWQMDIETRAAAGRVSELLGEKALAFDRNQRRKGMVYAAENSLNAMQANPHTKMMLDAYTAGINSYISTLCYKNYPIEYKLIGYAPEKWTNLKSALLLKYMADDLTGYSEDIPMTWLRDMLPQADLDLLYPERIPDSKPVIPAGTPFLPRSLPVVNPPADSVWMHYQAGDFEDRRSAHEGIGSNNWAISGARTKSGAPILCNDPHLALNLPSLWYEIQLQADSENVYGVSLPGAPGIIIGFNDSMAWGLTNNARDVKDYYAVKGVIGNSNAYWFDGKQLRYTKRIERIGIKGKPDFIDTVNYTIQGPVIYDQHFHGPGGLKSPLALCWMGHRATNELLAIYYLNKAKNYIDFINAIMNFQCPAQNMLYADKAGNIALWGQGLFVNKWKEQGRFLMNGADRAALWGDFIPMRENPHVFNPPQGYLCSANQLVTDSTYPYWYNGDFKEPRAWRINQVLDTLKNATVKDMFSLQNDTYSILAAGTLPIMLHYIDDAKLDTNQKNYIALLRGWNYRLSASSVAATVYMVWWSFLYNDIWKDDFGKAPAQLYPLEERTMQLMQTDTTLKYYDDRNTPAKEGLKDMVMKSFKEATDSLQQLAMKRSLEWYNVKRTTLTHLAKLSAFSYNDLKIGGWGNTINAAKTDHGPSWRMVVQLGKQTEAYGIYPGGQSGNPGSKYYGSFIQNWVNGEYYHLNFFSNKAQQTDNVKYTWTIKPD